MQKMTVFWWCRIPGKGNAIHAKLPIWFCRRMKFERMVLYGVSDVYACGTNQNLIFFWPRQKQGSTVKLWDAMQLTFLLHSVNILNNIENAKALMEKLCSQVKSLVCSMVPSSWKSEETMYSTKSSIHAARKDTPKFFSNTVLKFVTSFTTATKKESRRIVIAILFARVSA